MLRERLDVEVDWCRTVNKRLYVREDGFLLILHMIGDAVSILVIEFEDESGQIVILVERLYQLFANERQLKINIVSMRGLEIMQ